MSVHSLCAWYQNDKKRSPGPLALRTEVTDIFSHHVSAGTLIRSTGRAASACSCCTVYLSSLHLFISNTWDPCLVAEGGQFLNIVDSSSA